MTNEFVKEISRICADMDARHRELNRQAMIRLANNLGMPQLPDPQTNLIPAYAEIGESVRVGHNDWF